MPAGFQGPLTDPGCSRCPPLAAGRAPSASHGLRESRVSPSRGGPGGRPSPAPAGCCRALCAASCQPCRGRAGEALVPPPEPCSPLTRSHTPHPRLLFLIHCFLLSSRFRTSHQLIHLVALQTCLLLASMARSTAITCLPRPADWRHCLGPSPVSCVLPPLPPAVSHQVSIRALLCPLPPSLHSPPTLPGCLVSPCSFLPPCVLLPAVLPQRSSDRLMGSCAPP